MLIKTLFNLQPNSSADLPNQYFFILEKQQKYQDLHSKLLRLNTHNQNLIQSLSTIKITLFELLDQFIKPSDDSLIHKIHQAYVSAFSTIDQACSNLSKNIENKIQNYHHHIESLRKQCKQKLEQVTHYRKKVFSLEKEESSMTREEKDKLARNKHKKLTIEAQYKKVQSLLVKNYTNFHLQSKQFLKTVPQQILFHLVESNIETASQIIDILGSQLPTHKIRQRRQSIVSSVISQISDADSFSQSSDEDFTSSNEIKIIAEPISDEIIIDETQRVEIAKNEDTIDDHFSKSRSLRNWKSSQNNLKKSVLRRSSIQNERQKAQLIQTLKKVIFSQTFEPENLKFSSQIFENQSQIYPNESEIIETKHKIQEKQLEKVFQNIKAPLTHAEKIKQVFESKKNKFCDPISKPEKRKSSQTQISQLQQIYQKSFVLLKQEFKYKSKLELGSIKLVEIKEKTHLKNEETLKCSSDQQEFTEAVSPNLYESPRLKMKASSNSSKPSKNNSPSGNQNQEEFSINSPSGTKITAQNLFNRPTNFKNEGKNVNKISPQSNNQNATVHQQLKHHPTYSHLLNHHYFGSVHSIKKLPTQNQMKDANIFQKNNSKTIKNVFSGTNLKLNEKSIHDQNPFHAKPFNLPTSLQKKPSSELKDMFSIAFPHHNENQSIKQKNNENSQTPHLKINDQKSNTITIQSIKSVPTKRQIDFSIFEKIV